MTLGQMRSGDEMWSDEVRIRRDEVSTRDESRLDETI